MDHTVIELLESEPEALGLQALTCEGEMTLVLSGELDLASVPKLMEAIGRWSQTPMPLTLDLRRLRFIDSSGIKAVLSVRDACANFDCRLSIVPGPPAVHRVFELTGLANQIAWIDGPNARSHPARERFSSLPRSWESVSPRPPSAPGTRLQ